MVAPTNARHRRAAAARNGSSRLRASSTPDQKLSLSELRGRPVVLVFYPEDWSPVCSDQLALYQELLPEFERFDAQLVGISVDGIWCHLAFAQAGTPLSVCSADFEPKGDGLAAVRRLSKRRRHERTSAVRDRPRRRRQLELRLAGRRQPGADGILRALEELPSVRTQWEAALTLPVTEDRDHIQGAADAAVTLVEYGDYECPYCGAAYPIVKEIQEAMGDRLRFVFRNFPITTAHPHAEQAAEAAEAADAQGRFWPMHDHLYENQQRLEREDLVAYADRLGLDIERFERELEEHVHDARVREDFMSGVRSGVNGTPTFYINGVRHDDSYEFDTLLGALQRAAG